MTEPVTMTTEIAARLRAPFEAKQIGKLPRVWCGACRDANKQRRPSCDNHRKQKCQVCGNNITDAHLHLDYVGHAEITDRLLQVDPYWTWEPVAFDQDGLPKLDRNGGLWMRLTVAGVTRLGYGDAQGKDGPDAVKEAIGDGLRNGAMRFGVGLDLWGASGKGEAQAQAAADHHADTAPERPREEAPAPSNGNGRAKAAQNGNSKAPTQSSSEQATKAAGALLDAPDSKKLESLAGLVEERRISQADATAALTPADRKALGIDPEDKVTVDDLLGYLRTFHEQRKTGPRSDTAASQSREPAPLAG